MIRKLKVLMVMAVSKQDELFPAVVDSAIATGYDLLVIDNGSDEQWFRTSADLPCRTLRLEKQVGVAAVLLLGLKEAAKFGYDTVITIDGDRPHNPADIHLFVARAENSPSPCLVIGERQPARDMVDKSEQNRKTSTNFWVRLECGLEIADVESTFRLYPLKELLAQRLTADDSGFAIETIVKLAWAGVQVHSVPVSVADAAAAQQFDHWHALLNTFCVAFLHGKLVLRRLLPWPHKKLTAQDPFPKKVCETISGNPLKILGKICREHTSPTWLAMAVWLGIFMGALPLLAIHTIAIIYVAHRLHMNKVAAVAASQFCMPPVVPVLCIQMGYYLRNGELLVDFSWQPWLLGIHQRLWEWLIGSLLVGPTLGTIGAVIMYLTASRLQRGK
jgi:uncharacterized protein (DUF2062 family)